MMLHSFIAALIVAFSIRAHAQGCSDAGACTMSSLSPNAITSSDAPANRVTIGSFWGKADNSVSVYGSYVEYGRVLGSGVSFDAKVTSIAQSGNGIASFGLSDLYLNANIRLRESMVLTVGTKVPLSDAASESNDLPLPMDYQSSLGTFDVIVGVSYSLGSMQIVAAYQQPMTQNSNRFLASAYPTESKLREFQSTNDFRRSADLLIRVSHPFVISDRVVVTPSVLPIYHVANDRFLDDQGIEREIAGSRGLTLNANLFADYTVSDQDVLRVSVGIPLVVRTARPDGLTRSIIAALEYRMGF
ncbi:MAG: hypothetical protein FGM33_06495 [Candidatus Kapabacteria bacterium]|nr:hypothetical protein [Candidatus Kapabacteria bacterium]